MFIENSDVYTILRSLLEYDFFRDSEAVIFFIYGIIGYNKSLPDNSKYYKKISNVKKFSPAIELNFYIFCKI